MRTTEHHPNGPRSLGRASRFAGRAALLGLTCAVLLAVSGCSGGTGANTSAKSAAAEATATLGAHMAGPAAVVHVTQAAVDAVPKPWVLNTPQDAVRSYLDWTAYAYRIGQSVVATSVMGPDEAVRIDAYIQFNIEKKQLIDEHLQSLTLGTPSAGATGTLVPAKEMWTYQYLSTSEGNKLISGPYTASYTSTYTVAKNKKGDWVVFSVKATPKVKAK